MYVIKRKSDGMFYAGINDLGDTLTDDINKAIKYTYKESAEWDAIDDEEVIYIKDEDLGRPRPVWDKIKGE